ncbi:mechanosensitive ion channel family protein [Halosegnis sp.]|uniref:mechanosensitive ion channel family protein n=1 Tax=Halosegnis sp. TaxID=2864959 RepID=UPI0035D40DB7
MVAGIEWPVRVLERVATGAASTETRVAVTLAVVVGVVFAALVFTPYVTEAAVSIVHRWLQRRGAVESLADAETDVPWELLVRGLVRGLQAALLFAGVLAALVVWGEFGLATALGLAVATAAPVGLQVIATVVLGLLAYALTDLLETWLTEYAETSDYLNQHQEGIVFRVLQLSIIIATVLGTLFIWQVNPTGLLVGAGFLGIVVGMAARQTLGSVIAGFVLMFSRPMELSDWVEIDGHEGIVTDITIVNTRLRNFDGETVVIPNDRVSNSTVINRSQQGQLRVRVDVDIDYDADVERAREAVASVSEVAKNPKPQVVPTGFGGSAVDLQVRFWIPRPNVAYQVRARSAVVWEVKAAFDRADIKIPYPQRELSGRAETGGFQVAEPTEEAETRPNPGTDD